MDRVWDRIASIHEAAERDSELGFEEVLEEMRVVVVVGWGLGFWEVCWWVWREERDCEGWRGRVRVERGCVQEDIGG